MDFSDPNLEKRAAIDIDLAALLEERNALIVAITFWRSSDRPEATERLEEFNQLLVELDEEIRTNYLNRGGNDASE